MEICAKCSTRALLQQLGQKEMAAAIRANLINGMSDDTLGSDGMATRAQTAVILKRFLKAAHFID